MPYQAVMLALASAALFGVATPFSKSLLAGLQANQMAGLLYLGAALLLAPGVVRRAAAGGNLLPADTRNRLQLLGAIVFGGLLGPLFLLIGLRAALAASVSMWLNLETVATALIAWLLFKEHLGRWTWLGNIGVLASGLLLSLDGGWAGLLGILCVGAATICWGLDNNFTAVIDGITPQLCTFWKGLIAGAANLLIGVLFFPVQPGPGWLGALLLGGVSYGASIVLYISAAQRLGATRSQMIFASSPFFGVLLSVLWLGERISALQWVAGGLLAASIGAILLDRHGHEHQHDELTHEHAHRHDEEHHGHEHPDLPLSARHSHPHTHPPQRHAHPHWPDLHHRHAH